MGSTVAIHSSVLFQAMSSALNQNSISFSASDGEKVAEGRMRCRRESGERDQGRGVDHPLVVRQVLVERRARGHAGRLQLDDHRRQAVDEAALIAAGGRSAV